MANDIIEKTKTRRGFALVSAEKRQEISRKGGKTGGHRWTSEEAVIAGRKGGVISKRGPIKSIEAKGEDK